VIDLQQVIQARHVVAMAMRHDDEVELCEIDAFDFDVMRKDVGVVTSVKQNTLATILDEDGKNPNLSSFPTACQRRHRGR
jgi:hypothetical protein